MNEWLYVGLFAIFVFGIGLSMQIFGSFIGPIRKQKRKEDPYECGMAPLADTRTRFRVHFYLVAILFLLFDVETVFLIPWAVQSGCEEFGVGVFIGVIVFLAIVVFGLVYEWRRGALKWD